MSATEQKHTPGPWVRDQYGSIKAAGDTLRVNGVSLPCGGRPSDFEEIEANTRLIAAAPDLLEALKACIDYGAMTGDDWVAEKANAAIAKATGATYDN